MAAFDMDCRQKFSTVCQVLHPQEATCCEGLKIQQINQPLQSQDTVSQFWVRGLCPTSSLDTVYKVHLYLHLLLYQHLLLHQVLEELSGGRRQLAGPSGWRIHWLAASWILDNPRWLLWHTMEPISGFRTQLEK